MDGKPLFLRQLERILTFECIDEVYLDTESEEIIRVASHLDCKILKRDVNMHPIKPMVMSFFLIRYDR